MRVTETFLLIHPHSFTSLACTHSSFRSKMRQGGQRDKPVSGYNTAFAELNVTREY
jgi:hypothetical protein